MLAGTQTKLDQIRQKILADDPTPGLRGGATQLVFGDGNLSADIVFIGEAPGKNEDLQGLPFVGAAGRFLNEMLEMIGLRREDIYITNIVKYRPPNNRDPLPAEKKAFLPYLQSQLEAIQPKIVVTLGRHSLNCFLPDLQISACHGKPKRVRIAFSKQQAADSDSSKAAPHTGGSAAKPDGLAIVILPLFHPAAALYNGAMRQTLIDDFALIPDILKKLNQ